MPFISENLYHKLNGTNIEDSESIMIKSYPTVSYQNEEIDSFFDVVKDGVTSIRRAKVAVELANQKIEKASIKIDKNIDKKLAKIYIEKLAKVELIEFVDTKPNNSISDISKFVESYIAIDNIDLSSIIEKLEKQKIKIDKEIEKLNGMLNNKKFVQNAPKELIEENSKRLEELEIKNKKIESELEVFAN
jgi:valyl-tRNA synthetase